MMEVKGRDVVDSIPNFLPDEGIVGDVQREIKTDMLGAEQKMLNDVAGIKLGIAKENREHLEQMTEMASEYSLSEQRAVAKGLSFDVLALEVYRKGVIMGRFYDGVTNAHQAAADQEANFEIVKKGERKNAE